MSDEIVRRLLSKGKAHIQSLKESMPIQGLLEKDEEDIENEELDTAEEVDDTDDIDTEETDTEDFDVDDPVSSLKRSAPQDSSQVENDAEDEEEVVTPENPSLGEEGQEEGNINPLDNSYAVNYSIGQEVVLNYSTGSNSKLCGVIDGYDTEGFYRVKWSNGKTTNGFTDISLSEFVSNEDPIEEKCLCGGSEFVNEGANIVCDRCGRIINESSDPLTISDKSRPKGKRLIRSEAHPISTAISSNVVESKEEAEDSVFSKLSKLKGVFWSRVSEMIVDIIELGYDVPDYTAENVIVVYEDEDEDRELLVPIVGTSNTIALDIDKAREL